MLAAFERRLPGSGIVDDIVAPRAKVKRTAAGMKPDTSTAAQALERVEDEIVNVTAAIAAGGDLARLGQRVEGT